MANGQCGIAFGCWHIPDWLLSNVYALNDKAAFNAYILEGEDGAINCKHSNATTGYIVVSKKFAHPEIAVQITNLFYDELANSPELLEKYPEVADYVQNAVDGSSRPFNIEINSCTSLFDDYSELEKCLNGEITLEQVRTAEQRSNVPVIQGYLDVESGFEQFTASWREQGGTQIIQEISEQLK